MKIENLGNLIDIYDSYRKPLSKMQRASKPGDVPYYGANGVIDHVDSYLFEGEYILFAEDGTVMTENQTPVIYLTKPSEKFWLNNHAHIFKPKSIEIKYLFYALKNIKISRYVTGAVQPKINQENLQNIELKIHESLDMQKHIVDTISFALKCL